MSVLLDLSPEVREPAPISPASLPDREPGNVEMLARGLLGAPRYLERVLRGVPSALPT